jgi:thioredoxin-like negative regulator of GroEL
MSVNIIIGIIVIIIIGGISYYLYNSRPEKTFIYNNEYSSSVITNEGELILFYVKWCPHSNDALTKWNVIKDKYNNPKFKIVFSETDCEQYSEIATKYKIKEYPTIILVKDSKNYEYDADLSEETLNIFINTVMTQ